MEFRIEPLTLALNKLKFAFDVEKRGSPIDLMCRLICSVRSPFSLLFVLFLQDLSILPKPLNFLFEKNVMCYVIVLQDV